MAEDSDAERTEDPTARRLEEAREKGQIARSTELVTFSVLVAGFGSMLWWGGTMFDALKRVMTGNLRFDKGTLVDTDQMLAHLHLSAQEVLIAFLPMLGATAVAAIGASMVLSGWLFTLDPLAPDFGKLNPMNGIGRMFSVRALVEMGKSILKSGLIGGVAVAVMWSQRNEIIQLIAMSPFESLAYLWKMVRFTLGMVIGSMIIIVGIDVPFQLWEFNRNLRMSKEEVKREARESEGDPQVKARIRQLQMQAARKRMMAEIPKANVIVTNPTHYAVALKYDETMRAPQVVAKGSFLLAERIIALGREHKVPVMRTPPLARALYHHAELGDDIPSALYTAVAEVMAYLYQMRTWNAVGGVAPVEPTNLQVPADLDPGGEA